MPRIRWGIARHSSDWRVAAAWPLLGAATRWRPLPRSGRSLGLVSRRLCGGAAPLAFGFVAARRRGVGGGAAAWRWQRRSRWAAATVQLRAKAEEASAAEGRAVYEAAHGLGAGLARLCAEADAELHRNPPTSSWLPEGCEDAPPEIKAKLAAMTAGAAPFPADPAVEALEAELTAEASGDGAASSEGHAWSPSRFLQQSTEPLAAPASDFAGDEADAYVADLRRRWAAVRGALARGLCTEPPAADDPADRLEVYVTHLTNDDYVLGAEMLAASLLAACTTRPLLALITDGVSAAGRAALERAGWALVEVGLVGFEGDDTPQARGFFSKIWLWALPVHRVIYIDTDILVLKSLDHLFDSDAALGAALDSQPAMDNEDIVQTGLLVLKPSAELFADLWLICSGRNRPMILDDWRQFEQGFFTIYFDGGSELDGFGGGCQLGWKRLTAHYNFCVRYLLRPLYTVDGELLGPTSSCVVHFACAKPWDPAQRNHAPAPYVRLYLEFAQLAGIRWRTVDCVSDRARELVNMEKIRKLQEERQFQT